MRTFAESITTSANVQYKMASSDQTGLGSSCADIVTCSQALHWMEPFSTFLEAARVLRKGGVFAAYDCDWPPLTGHWQADRAYRECMAVVKDLEASVNSRSRATSWPKEGHLERMRESGRFTFITEAALHSIERGNADRIIGLLMSQGAVKALLRLGYTEKDLAIPWFKDEVRELLGTEQDDWHWTYRLRIGIIP
jgi:hypothetical protein